MNHLYCFLLKVNFLSKWQMLSCCWLSLFSGLIMNGLIWGNRFDSKWNYRARFQRIRAEISGMIIVCFRVIHSNSALIVLVLIVSTLCLTNKSLFLCVIKVTEHCVGLFCIWIFSPVIGLIEHQTVKLNNVLFKLEDKIKERVVWLACLLKTSG